MANPDQAFESLPADLASGDSKALSLDRKGLEIARIQSSDHPLFATAYQRLSEEFGPQGEMESQEVIAKRLAWYPAAKIADCWMRYEMVLVRRQGEFVGVRDHTAIITVRLSSRGHGARTFLSAETPETFTPHECSTPVLPFHVAADRNVRAPGPEEFRAVVHLSHILVAPEWRRTGIAGWLRAWPIQTARACLAAAGFPITAPITLALEMERPDAQFEKAMIRIKAYEKAGFKKVDPSAVKYYQPDFRGPEEIDTSGGPRPLPFCLLLRRLGREQEQSIRGAEVREIVECLYHMYGTGCREQDMAQLWRLLKDYPQTETQIALIAPSQ